MRLKQQFTMVLLVMVPLVLLVSLTMRLERAERENVARTYDELLRGRLLEADRLLTGLLEERARSLEQALAEDLPDEEARQTLSRSMPWLTQFFAQAPDGRVEHPAVEAGLSREESLFLERCRVLFDQKLLLTPPADGAAGMTTAATPNVTGSESAPPSSTNRFEARAPGGGATSPIRVSPVQMQTPWSRSELEQAMQQQVEMVMPPSQQTLPPSFERTIDRALERYGVGGRRRAQPGANGWFPYYYGHDLRLLYIVKTTGGGVRGVELSRSRLIADLIGRIPEPTMDDQILRAGSMLLVDGGGRPLYRWGGYLPPAGARPRLQVSLSFPLHPWTVQYYPSPAVADGAVGSQRSTSLMISLIASILALVALGLTVYRDQRHELLEASRRVTFVNQVSHELKTPLTNIRLHAELLERELPEDDTDSRRRLSIVISESQRLGRLIGNVLTFSRQQRERVTLRRVQAVPDDTVRQVVERFAPALEGCGISPDVHLNATEPVLIDPDALEQILNNLLSNVEKYAAAGGVVRIATRVEGTFLYLLVSDRGPGIPPGQREAVFEPFTRLNDHLTEGVSGAGIGLTISRELARKHGGNLCHTDDVAFLRRLFADVTIGDAGGAHFVASLSLGPDAGKEHV